MRKLNRISEDKKQEITIKVINRIDNLLKQDKYKNNQKISRVLEYLRLKLVKELF
jgi:hypothetical protein